MNKLNIVKVAKVGGMVLSIGGMIVSAWVSGKENEMTLQRLVNEHLQK